MTPAMGILPTSEVTYVPSACWVSRHGAGPVGLLSPSELGFQLFEGQARHHELLPGCLLPRRGSCRGGYLSLPTGVVAGLTLPGPDRRLGLAHVHGRGLRHVVEPDDPARRLLDIARARSDDEVVVVAQLVDQPAHLAPVGGHVGEVVARRLQHAPEVERRLLDDGVRLRLDLVDLRADAAGVERILARPLLADGAGEIELALVDGQLHEAGGVVRARGLLDPLALLLVEGDRAGREGLGAGQLALQFLDALGQLRLLAALPTEDV